MKLPKTLIGAIIIGISLQTSSCKKEKPPEPKDKKEAKKEGEEKPPFLCLACGMG